MTTRQSPLSGTYQAEISFTMASQLLVAVPMLEEYNLRSTFMCIRVMTTKKG